MVSRFLDDNSIAMTFYISISVLLHAYCQENRGVAAPIVTASCFLHGATQWSSTATAGGAVGDTRDMPANVRNGAELG